ncbi:MAG: NfeD family protein [Candidatus Gastranaerophilales bacterium]|nr:NfeD family protein [Candidatus Gastranaerophilales bacterium]
MNLWLILLIISVAFLIMEMFTPTLFFINLSIAAAVSAFIAYCGYSGTVITFVFLIISIATIGLIRPILLGKMQNKKEQTGMDDKYIGKTAKVITNVTKDDGRVSIYGEEWQAKLDQTSQDEVVNAGEQVKIISVDSIIFTVEKVKEN